MAPCPYCGAEGFIANPYPEASKCAHCNAVFYGSDRPANRLRCTNPDVRGNGFTPGGGPIRLTWPARPAIAASSTSLYLGRGKPLSCCVGPSRFLFSCLRGLISVFGASFAYPGCRLALPPRMPGLSSLFRHPMPLFVPLLWHNPRRVHCSPASPLLPAGPRRRLCFRRLRLHFARRFPIPATTAHYNQTSNPIFLG